MSISDTLKNYAGSVISITGHIGTFAAGAAVAVGVLGITAISQDQLNQLFEAFKQLGTAVSSGLAALGTIVGIGTTVYRAFKATKAQVTKDASQIPGVQIHVDTSPASPAPPQVQKLALTPESEDPKAKDVVPMTGPPVDTMVKAKPTSGLE